MALAKVKTWKQIISASDKLKGPDHALLDSINLLLEQRRGVTTDLAWNRGHSGDRVNEMADLEANRARERMDSGQRMSLAFSSSWVLKRIVSVDTQGGC